VVGEEDDGIIVRSGCVVVASGAAESELQFAAPSSSERGREGNDLEDGGVPFMEEVLVERVGGAVDHHPTSMA